MMFVITFPGFDELVIMSLSIELLLSGVSFELVIIVSSYLKLFLSFMLKLRVGWLSLILCCRFDGIGLLDDFKLKI